MRGKLLLILLLLPAVGFAKNHNEEGDLNKDKKNDVSETSTSTIEKNNH